MWQDREWSSRFCPNCLCYRNASLIIRKTPLIIDLYCHIFMNKVEQGKTYVEYDKTTWNIRGTAA